jgi:hypothetical protein
VLPVAGMRDPDGDVNGGLILNALPRDGRRAREIPLLLGREPVAKGFLERVLLATRGQGRRKKMRRVDQSSEAS